MPNSDDMDDGNVSFIVTLRPICNTNTTLCAVCPDIVTITMTTGPPYTPGDKLRCSSDGYPAATYTWTVDGKPGSITNTQALVEGEHVYVCTAIVDLGAGDTCSDNTTLSKYPKQYNTSVTILVFWC